MCIVPLMKAEKDEKWIIAEFAKKGTLDFWIKFNPFVPNTPFLYPLKTSVFRGRESLHWERRVKLKYISNSIT